MMVVQLVLARMTSGITDASATRRASMPWTRQCWSTTAMASLSGPILQVPERCWPMQTSRSIQLSSASSETRSDSVGEISPS